MRLAKAAAIAAIMLVAGAAVGFLIGTGTTQVPRTLSTTVTSVLVTTFSSTLTTSVIVTSSVFVTRTAVDTTGYYVANVTDDISVPAEGYIFFVNNSVRFEGVNFTTLCPGITPWCGDQLTLTRIQGIPSAGWIELQMSFPDGKNETLLNNVGSSDYTVLLAQHANPTAGIEFQYVAQTSQYEVFLLVSK
ncbi:MAG TPA: hypothetical protein VKF39_00130 [Nitrososphaerales archaeon]|nr:hypothetical protein [Nitrososphaerales archaeon]